MVVLFVTMNTTEMLLTPDLQQQLEDVLSASLTENIIVVQTFFVDSNIDQKMRLSLTWRIRTQTSF